MDILSPVAAAVIALFELVCQEETAYFDDYELPVADPWELDSNLRCNLLDTHRHIRHQDSVQGIDMDQPTAWMLVRGTSPRHGADQWWHLVSYPILF